MAQKNEELKRKAADTCAQVVRNLQPIGDVTSRHMFGGHGIFENGKMFAMVTSQAEIYLKADESNRPRFEEAGAKQHGKMPYFQVPADVLADEGLFHEWASVSIQIAHAGKKKRR